MAINSTIFKVDLQVTDTDRDYYDAHKLTLARHPSETDERLMMRLLVFALHADPALEFAGAISTEDTPALWKKNLSGEIIDWIELGYPDEKRIKKACGRARKVYIYCYGMHRARPWWQSLKGKLDRFDNLSVIVLADDQVAPLPAMAQRTMQLYCTIQDGSITFGDDPREATIVPEVWLARRAS
ncbi:MAG: YaeQ family protein [Spirochaetota bacterium]